MVAPKRYSSIQFSSSVVSDSLRPHGLQHGKPPCPSPAPGVYSNSCPLSADAIQPSHPLSPPSLLAFNLSQHQGLFQWVSSLHQAAKVLEFQLQHQSYQWTFRTDFLETLNMTVSGQRVFADISKTSWVKNILDYIQWCVLVRDRRPRTQRQSPREDGNRDRSYAATSQGGSEPQKFRKRQGRFLPQSLWSDYNSANTLTVTSWSRIVRE